jgi:hypothetical protein
MFLIDHGTLYFNVVVISPFSIENFRQAKPPGAHVHC